MLLIAIAWMYVVTMVAVVEAVSDNGTVLGAFFTFVLYGLLPLGIVGYLYFAPARRRARRAAQARLDAAAVMPTAGDASTGAKAALDPDQRRHPAGDAVAPVREEP